MLWDCSNIKTIWKHMHEAQNELTQSPERSTETTDPDKKQATQNKAPKPEPQPDQMVIGEQNKHTSHTPTTQQEITLKRISKRISGNITTTQNTHKTTQRKKYIRNGQTREGEQM